MCNPLHLHTHASYRIVNVVQVHTHELSRRMKRYGLGSQPTALKRSCYPVASVELPRMPPPASARHDISSTVAPKLDEEGAGKNTENPTPFYEFRLLSGLIFVLPSPLFCIFVTSQPAPESTLAPSVQWGCTWQNIRFGGDDYKIFPTAAPRFPFRTMTVGHK